MAKRKMIDFAMDYIDDEGDAARHHLKAYDETDAQQKFSGKFPRNKLAAVSRV